MPGAFLSREAAHQELARCASWEGGFRYWLEHYARIEDRNAGVIPFEMWPCHIEACDALETSRLIVVLKARQIGMSWLFGTAYPLWMAMFHPYQLAMLFSHRENEAADLIRRIKFMWTHLPPWQKVPISKDNSYELEFAKMNSRILAFPSSPDAGSGYTASYVFADEHAKQPYAREQYTALRPTVDAGGIFVSNSTAKGLGTFHYQLWKGAVSGTNGFTPLFFGWQARPNRTPQWYESIKQSYPEEWMVHQEYPDNPDEAFVSSVPRRFSALSLKLTASNCVPRTTSTHPLLSYLLQLKATPKTVGFRLYQEPSATHSYVIGVDVAGGDAGGDAHAAIVLDAATGEEVACLHGRWPIPTWIRLIDLLATAFRARPLAVERNNHGHAVLLGLEQLRLKRLREGKQTEYILYYEKPVLNKQGAIVRPGKPGWLTTARSKHMMLDALEQAFVQTDVRIATEAVLQEAKTVANHDDGSVGAEAGMYDDLVMALAIAWMVLLQAPRQTVRPKVAFHMGPHGSALHREKPRVSSIRKSRQEREKRRATLMERLQGVPAGASRSSWRPKPTSGVSAW